jgi:hypothetical protein
MEDGDMRNLRRLSLLIIGFLLACSAAFAQLDRGTITGIVTDQSGAVVPGVAITVTNTATGVKDNSTTNESGVYSLPLLPQSTYVMVAVKEGFKKYTQTNIVVTVGGTTRTDVALTIGSSKETVEVTAEAPLLERETSDTSTTVTAREVDSLPLVSNGDQRTPATFMQLAPGVAGRDESEGGIGDNRTDTTQVSGSMVSSTTIAIEGADLMTDAGFEGDLRALQMPPDAVSEFKLEATNASAEYGRSGGGSADFEVKSGTNQIHGTAYELLRNQIFNSIPFFQNSSTPGCNANGDPVDGTNGAAVKQCESPFKQNEFGVTAGGPIKKDKAFIFGYYDGFRLIKPGSSGTATVPDAAMVQGNFQEFQSLVPENILYDPTTLGPGGTPAQCGPEICDNVVNPTAFSAISKKILPYFPAANTNFCTVVSASCNPTVNNFFSAVPNTVSVNEYGFKGDYNFNDRNRISAVYLYGNYTTPNIGSIPAPLGGGDQPSFNKTRNLRVNYNMILRPNLDNHAVLAYNLWDSGTPAVSSYGGMSDWSSFLGLQGFDPTLPTQFPQIVIGANGESFNGGGGEGVSEEHSEEVGDTLTWIKGKHTVKFGFEYIKNALNGVSTGRNAGWFEFAASTVGIPSDPNSGVPFASYLLGISDRVQSYVYTTPNYARDFYLAGFAQDDFKITKKLTLNVGVRWDLFDPDVHKYGTKSWANDSIENPGAPGELTAMSYGFSAQYPSGVKTHFHNFSPRIGLAYSLNDKTVIRAAYGVYFADGNSDRLDGGQYVQGYNLSPSIGNINQPTPAFQWDTSVFPTFTPSLTPISENGESPYMTDPSDGVAPYAENYQISVQRELPGKITVTGSFVGNTGVHLPSLLMPTTQMPPQYLGLGSTCYASGTSSTVVPCTTGGAVPTLFMPLSSAVGQGVLGPMASEPVDPATGNHSPFPGFEALWGADNPGNLTVGKALSIRPQYQSLDRGYEGVATSAYNSLQIKADKRFSNGLTLLASYAWSKTLTNGGAIFGVFSSEFGSDDVWNAHTQKAYSFADIPNMASIAFVYDLPVGLGRKFMNHGGVVSQIIGGWTVSGVQQYQQGEPQNIESPVTSGSLEMMNGFNTPDNYKGIPMASAADRSGNFDPHVDSQFNNAAFTFPSTFGFGTLTPTEGTVRSFGYFDEDYSLIKEWTLHESFKLDFRVDVINAFNRVQFAQNDGAYANEPLFGSSGFGTLGNQANSPRNFQFGLKLKW